MFYAHFILKKRGPLSRIWLAAHWDKKLTKTHIFETDIEGSVKAILSPQLKLALRTSSHLLIGIVRIYSRKAKYLLADCNEAFVKIKLAFRPGMVDLPAEHREASLATINIREDFTSFDLDVPDFSEIDFHTRFAVNQSRPEDITMREEVSCLPYVGDDGFVDDDGLGGPVSIKSVDQLLSQLNAGNYQHLSDYFDHVESRLQGIDVQSHFFLRTPQKLNRNASLADSGFGSPSVWADIINPAVRDLFGSPTKVPGSCLRQGAGDFGFNPGSVAIPEVSLDDILLEQHMEQNDVQPTELLRQRENDHSEDELRRTETGDVQQHLLESHSVGGGDHDDDDHDDGYCNYDACDDDGSSVHGGDVEKDPKLFSEDNIPNEENRLLYEEPRSSTPCPVKASVSASDFVAVDAVCEDPVEKTSHGTKLPAVVNDLTTLIENDAEAFALGPVEVNLKERKTKRKRRLIVDESKVILSETMKNQLSDTSDLVVPLDLAPPTKKLMQWKESGGIDKLFVLPGIPLVTKKLFKLFDRNLFTTSVFNDDPDALDAAAGAAAAAAGAAAATGAADEVGDETRPPELQRAEAEAADTSHDLSLSLFSDLDDKAPCPETNVSCCLDDTPFLAATSFPPSPKSLTRIEGGNDLPPEMNIPSPEKLPLLPDLDSFTEIQPADKAGPGSPPRKRRKHQPTATSAEPAARAPTATSDLEDDVENEDAIFDVEVAPTCSEKATLRHELEEAELEEKLWNRRSTLMQHILRRRLETSTVTSFKQLTVGNNRKQAASKFYTILVLTKACAINVEQSQPYGDVVISRGSAFAGIV